jgi:hypothetical protein
VTNQGYSAVELFLFRNIINPHLKNKTMTTITFFALISGIFWTITYLLILQRSLQDRIIGMPMVALCMNIAWEFIFSFVYPSNTPQLYVNYVWFCFDIVIVTQYLKLNESVFSEHLPKKLFYPAFCSVLVISFLNMLFATTELGTKLGSHYTAFEINLIMSVLFIYLLLSSDRTQGQSIYIAITKMIGTAFASVMSFLEFPSSPLLNFLYVAIFFCDGAYTVILQKKLAVKDLRLEQEMMPTEN